jgi:hypothetical protein
LRTPFIIDYFKGIWMTRLKQTVLIAAVAASFFTAPGFADTSGVIETSPGMWDGVVNGPGVDFISTDYSLIDVHNNLEILRFEHAQNWNFCDALANSTDGQIGSCVGKDLLDGLRFSGDAGWRVGDSQDIFNVYNNIMDSQSITNFSSTHIKAYKEPLMSFLSDTLGKTSDAPRESFVKPFFSVHTLDTFPSRSVSLLNAYDHSADSKQWQFTTLVNNAGNESLNGIIPDTSVLYVRDFNNEFRGSGLLMNNNTNEAGTADLNAAGSGTLLLLFSSLLFMRKKRNSA